MKGEISGLEVSADVALIAMAVTLPTVPWLKRISPALPGSAIVVELSNVYLNADAPVAASALVALAALAVALLLEFVACVLAVEAEVLALEAWVLAVEAELAAAVALEAAAVAEVEAALALEAAAVALVAAAAASTNRTHLAASVLLEIGWDPEEVWATIQR